MRRHLSPEEVAEQRQRARARREAARAEGASGSPLPGGSGERPAARSPQRPPHRPPERPSAARPREPLPESGSESGLGSGSEGRRRYGRFDPGPGAAGVPRETPSADPRGDHRRSAEPGAPRYQPTQRPERFDDGYVTDRPRRASRHAPPRNPVVTPGAGRPSARPAAPRKTPRRRRRVPILGTLALLLVILLTAGVLTTLWADSKLQHVDALSSFDGRPGKTPGTVTLIVGTDSRAGLTEEQQAQLSTGSEQDAGGDRTDTMMLVYKPADGGKAMIISVPRDLLVDVPGYGEYKINAAYSLGGPKLLVQTLETETGVRIDHYAEIGFGGFAGIVDSLGGIDVCIDEPIDDPDAGINLPAGCQTLAGPQALGFVRTRHGFAQQDLQRVQNQRTFLSALMSKMAKPSTVLNPFRLTSVISEGAKATVVDDGDHIWDLARVMWSIRSHPVTATVPFDGMADGDVGSYLVWGDTTNAFFDQMRQGKTPPPELYETPPQ